MSLLSLAQSEGSVCVVRWKDCVLHSNSYIFLIVYFFADVLMASSVLSSVWQAVLEFCGPKEVLTVSVLTCCYAPVWLNT